MSFFHIFPTFFQPATLLAMSSHGGRKPRRRWLGFGSVCLWVMGLQLYPEISEGLTFIIPPKAPTLGEGNGDKGKIKELGKVVSRPALGDVIERSEEASDRDFSLLLASQFPVFVAVGALIPVLPLFGQEFGLSQSSVGLLLGTFRFEKHETYWTTVPFETVCGTNKQHTHTNQFCFF